MSILSQNIPVMDWKKILKESQEKLEVNRLRVYCRTGRPLGSDKFISRLETLLGRRLRALSVGRPIKRKGNKNVENNR
jgi:hypothetical protein